MPVMVCLTYADKLYAEYMGKDGSHPDPLDMKQKIAEETDVSSSKINLSNFNLWGAKSLKK